MTGYIEATCCDANTELRYTAVKQCSTLNSLCSAVYFDKLTNSIVINPNDIDLCALVMPFPANLPENPAAPTIPTHPLILDDFFKKLDPLTIDPHYTPNSFDKQRITEVEQTENNELINVYDRVGNKHGRWFLSGFNFTRLELYDLNRGTED